ncbi:hypothetical protein HDR63_03275 [bacterium]|nr:hypothetical protein [bacterium]
MPYVFKFPQTRALIDYVDTQYGRDLEHLWPRTPENAIWRRGDNNKWFGAILSVPANKIEPTAEPKPLEILDIRCAPDMLEYVVDHHKIFPGWHMNKKHWITIPLDGRMTLPQIQSLLDASFELAGAKK